jgi:hypothetical protein
MEGNTSPLNQDESNPCEVVALYPTDAAEHHPSYAVQPATHPEPTL